MYSTWLQRKYGWGILWDARHDINFTFVEVDKYEGEGTGPAYSINQCKEHLKDHLFGVTSVTIISDELPNIESNWLGVYPTDMHELFGNG